MRPQHKKAHPACPNGANWSHCDAVVKALYENWQAMQQVLLAYLIVTEGRAGAFKKDDTQFGQLVQLIAGAREKFVNKDGNESEAGFVIKLRAAIQHVVAGDLPAYNLYHIPVPPGAG